MTYPVRITSEGGMSGAKVAVGDQNVPMLRSIKLDIPLPGKGPATIDLEMLAVDGLDVALPADVSVAIAVLDDVNFVLVEEPQGDGTTRYYAARRQEASA